MVKKSNENKLTKKQLERYRELLLEKRREIYGSVESMEETIFQGGGELSSMPVHMADVGSDNFEQEFSLGLMAEEKKILTEIDMALRRIEDGSFGICEGLSVPIESQRLEAIPWTRYSLEYAKQLEKHRIPGNLRQRPLDINRLSDDMDDTDSEDDIETEELDEEISDTEVEAIDVAQDEPEDFDDDEIGEQDLKD